MMNFHIRNKGEMRKNYETIETIYCWHSRSYNVDKYILYAGIGDR